MSRAARGSWLAVDREGFIGRFRPGARGIIPRRALARARGERLTHAVDVACLVRVLLEQDEPVRPTALLPDGVVIVFHGDAKAGQGYRDNARDPVPASLVRFAPRVLGRAPLVIETQAEIDVETMMALAKDPEVRHLIAARDVELFAQQLGPSAALHDYRHDDEAHEDHEYARVSRALPAQPLHESMIPAPERAALVALRIPVALAASDTIDARGLEAERLPSDHAPPRPEGVAPVGRFVGGWAWLVLTVVVAVMIQVLMMLRHR